jgi:hypothetical protein
MLLSAKDKKGLMIIWLLGATVGYLHFNSPAILEIMVWGSTQLICMLILASIPHLFLIMLEKCKLKKIKGNSDKMKRTIRFGIACSIIITTTAFILYFSNYPV